MKKIFYILAAAIVALGTVACENEGLDNINPNINVDGDTVSFVAGINRTDLEGVATVWDEDDTIVVTWNENNYEFKNAETGDKNTFKCTAEGLSAIVNAENIKAVYSNKKDGNVDSAEGVAGALLEYEGAFGDIAFEVKNAFLKFTANAGSEVKFTASAEIFSTGTELTLTATGEDQYVAVIPKTTTITYALDGVVCTTSEENTLKACKIYPLSNLDKVVVIKTKEDFLTFAEAVNNGTSYEGYTVELVKDIELTEAWTPVGQTGATQFHGTFDGQGHTIKGLTINAPESYSTNYATGMFGWVETGAVIKNIVLDEANINGYHYVGAIAGYMSGSAKIEGCKVINSEIVADPTKKDTAGEFNGDKVGGIVGYTNGSNVISGNEVSKTTIKGYRHMGGIVGYLLGTAENNTVDDTVVITVNNDNNYKNYAIQSNYGVNNIAGVVTGSATNNNGEVTIVWGDIPATLVNYVAQVGENKYETIKDAIAAANAAGASEIVIIDNVDLAEDRLSGFAGTIKGGEDVVLDFSNFPAASNYAFSISGTTTFENITFKFPAKPSNYLSAGLVGEGEFTFENCAFEGCFTINGNAEWAFNKCTFTNYEYYASFVYAAKEVVFTECSFSGEDRAAKIYGDGGDLYVEYHNCEFTSTTTNKAAIAIDATSANTIVIVDECSQTNMNGLYSLDGTKGVVNPVAKDNNGKFYGSFEAALAAAEAGSTIELLANVEDPVTISKACVINAGEYTINIHPGEGFKVTNDGTTWTVKQLIAFYVENNASWSKVNLYAWDSSAAKTKILGEWPGLEMTRVGETNKYYVEIPEEYVGTTINYIINNGSSQTRDLQVKTFAAGYTHTIGDPDPTKITIYLNNNWSVANLKMHTWNPVLWSGQTWENQRKPDGTITTDWGTYSYWNVDANQIKSDKTGSLLITGTGKQTADLHNVSYAKDVYIEFVYKNNQDSLQILTTPY